MKKTSVGKRLSLSRTTLRSLNQKDLVKAGGARAEDSEGFTCFNCSEMCTGGPTHYWSGCPGCSDDSINGC
jgi:hypothetical protein